MPFVGLTKNEYGELKHQKGIFVDIYKELSMLLNFSYTVTTPPDFQWGNIKSDGTWTGMVGQLVTREVDFGIHCTIIESNFLFTITFLRG